MAAETKTVYVYGASGHALVVSTVLEDLGVSVTAMFEDHPGRSHHLATNLVPGLVAGGETVTLDRPIVLAVGDNATRQRVAGLIASDFHTTIHPSVLVAQRVTIGAGTVALQGAVIQHNTRIGAHVIINTSASVDHDNTIGDFVHISPRATLCGHVTVGEGTHVGAGATVIPGVTIGAWATIGAGAVVTQDVPDGVIVIGVPAKPVRPGESTLSELGDRS